MSLFQSPSSLTKTEQAGRAVPSASITRTEGPSELHFSQTEVSVCSAICAGVLGSLQGSHEQVSVCVFIPMVI